MLFPKIGKLRKGGYYVMPILGDCTLHFPVPDDQGEAETLINEVESFLIKQRAVNNVKESHRYEIQVELETEPEPPELA